MSCQISGSAKFLEVCFDDKHATYSFGKAGQVPELTLQTTLAALDYRPWNATGTAIVEEVVFYNKNYAYGRKRHANDSNKSNYFAKQEIRLDCCSWWN
jgi:hypothetical protein